MTVSELNEYVRSLLAKSPVLADVTIRGEISNFTFHRASGHLYFSLKDADGVLSAVMFRSAAQRLRFQPETGMKVLARGSVSVFVRDGKYQLYVASMEPDGIGSLYLAFEQLKKKLEGEGLFDEKRKRSLPVMPRRIGVITSPTGAAVRDIIQILGRRYPYAEVVLYPALVQGTEAAATLRAGVLYFNRAETVDVIIVGRGGGSFEDLYAFNDELLAREIVASTIPVVSAVGHETDFTICDFVADCRAPTPSAAAELVVPDSQDILLGIQNISNRMRQATINRLSLHRKAIANLAARPVLSKPEGLYREQTMRLLSAGERLNHHVREHLTAARGRFREAAAGLDALNPLGVLLRGYGVAYDDRGRVVSTVKAVSEGDPFRYRLHDGEVCGRVERVVSYHNIRKTEEINEKE
ncbi:MAG: exodeoxyribonuclease VII large subunit [Clostridia bacterium]|nr:exodeoxyribonuclease VII large subunit [Clostridia bacterium]